MEGKNKNIFKNLVEWLIRFRAKERLSRFSYYFRIWTMMSKNAFMMYFNQKKILVIFLVGKILRFIFFVTFLYFLVSGSQGLAGYTSDQVIFFFLTFSIVDITSQFLFREVYHFRTLVISGDLDLILAKPINPLFRIILGGADVIDFITIPPILIAIAYFGFKFEPALLDILVYILLLANALLISLAFHIFVVGMGIITLEVDHTVMIFRDLSRLGTIPIDVFNEPFRSFITFIIPIGIMLSFPSKAFFGLLSIQMILFSLGFGAVCFSLSLKFWNFALKKYTSASS